MSHKERKQREEVLSNWVKMILKEHSQRALDMILPDNLNLQIQQPNLPILLWLEIFTKQIYLLLYMDKNLTVPGNMTGKFDG